MDDTLLRPIYFPSLKAQSLQKRYLTEKIGLTSLYVVPRYLLAAFLPESEQEELARLRKEVSRLRMEREILPLEMSISSRYIFASFPSENSFRRKQGAHRSCPLLES